MILICSIVTGGVADRDGQLKVGDKLIAINRRNVEGLPLSDVVNILTTIERGTVVITVVHKLSAREDEKAFFGSMGGGSGEFPIIREEISPPEAVQVPSKDVSNQIMIEPSMVRNIMCLYMHSYSFDLHPCKCYKDVCNIAVPKSPDYQLGHVSGYLWFCCSSAHILLLLAIFSVVNVCALYLV